MVELVCTDPDPAPGEVTGSLSTDVSAGCVRPVLGSLSRGQGLEEAWRLMARP